MAFTEASGPGTNLVQNPSWLGFTSPNYKQNNTKKKYFEASQKPQKLPCRLYLYLFFLNK